MFNIKILSDNIKKFRINKNITQKELADILMVSPQAVSRWECGLSAPDISNLYDISKVLGISVDTLIGADNLKQRTMIGIDGGGSKTEFVLFDDSGRILNKVTLGGCNPNFYGINESNEILKSGIDMLLGHSPNPLGIYIGCAGMGAKENAREVKNNLKEFYPHIEISIKSDIFNVVASATDDENCFAAICGTGVSVFAVQGDSFERFGGWGYLLDNGGSGFDIGRDALRYALSERENKKNPSLLTELCEAKTGGNIYTTFSEIYKKDISYIASFAPIVFEAYEKGDKNAEEILEKNAKRFSEYILTAKKSNENFNTIVISGSIVEKNKVYLDMLKKKIGKDLNIIIPKHPQIFGSCIKCAKMCNIPTEKIKDSFMKFYLQGDY